MDFSTLYKENKLVRNTAVVLGLLCFILGFASPYYFADFGIGYMDEPYHVLLAWDYHNAPMSFLSSYVIGLWGKAFGFHMLSMRYFAITIQMLGYACACVFMYRRVRKPLLCMFVTGLGAYLYNTSIPLTLLGWDPLSIFFVTLTTIAVLRYIEKQSFLNILLMALFGSGAAFARLPNAVLFPVIVMVIAICRLRTLSWKRTLIHMGFFIAISGALLIGIIILFYGTPLSYIEALQRNIVANHDMNAQLRQIFVCIQQVLPICTFTWLLFFIVKYILRFGTVIRVFSFCVLYLFVYYYYILNIGSGATLSVYVTNYIALAYFIYILLFGCMTTTSTPSILGKIVQYIPFFIIFTFSLIAVIGSNVVFAKFLTIGLLPLVLAYTLDKYNKTTIAYSLLLVVTLLPLIYKRTRMLALYDIGTINATATINNPLYRGITTHPDGVDFLNTLDSEIKRTANTEQLFISDVEARFIAYYMANKIPQIDLHNWNYGNFSNPDVIKRNIDFIHQCKKPVSVFIIRKEGSKSAPYSPEVYQPTEEALLKEGLVKVKEYGTFAIYSNVENNE